MSIRSKNLSEGDYLKFLIYKKTVLPDESREVFILIGPDKNKYLLNATYYDHYDLMPGQTITCKVDKINCSGQVFLEPEHPFYKEGGIYDFKLIGLKNGLNIRGEKFHTAIVEDLHFRNWEFIVSDPCKLVPGSSILSCEVKRIKKSQLHLNLQGEIFFDPLKAGKKYNFKLTGEKQFKSESFYILEDNYQRIHFMPKKYYSHFNFVKGQIITALVVDIKTDGSLSLEPDNPYYKTGSIYNFSFQGMEKSKTDYGGVKEIIWVKDIFSQQTAVKPHKWQTEIISYFPEQISCRVVQYRKGKLILDNLEVEPC